MAIGQWAVVLQHVQRLFHGGGVSGLTEGQLLDRFVSDRDDVAFGAIVARHGPMVLGVCRGVLDDPHDVEDAFQATFLVLVRKAKVLRDRDLLAQWLYGVARKVALRARADSHRRRSRERAEVEAESGPSETLDSDLRELRVVIREEVDRLPDNDRMAVVLCYLEGLTHEEAAGRLGWPVGTVKGRLSRAREKLKGRLTRRGVALPAVALAPAIARGASAAVPLALFKSTILAASRLAAGKALTAGVVSAQAISLMEGAIGTMFTTKLKLGAMALAATCTVAVPGVLAYQGQGAGGQGPAAKVAPQGGLPQETAKSEVYRTSGKIGAVKSAEPDPTRKEMAKLAEEAWPFLIELYRNARVEGDEQLYLWSRRIVEAQFGPDADEVTRKAALQDHKQRMEKVLEIAKARNESARSTKLAVLAYQYRVLEADRWIKAGRIVDFGDEAESFPPAAPGMGRMMMGMMQGQQGKAQTKAAPGMIGGGMMANMMGGDGGLRGGGGLTGAGGIPSLNQTPEDEKKNDAIRKKLDEPIAMNFPNDTPLEDVKKYIEQATQDEAAGFPTGLPIYFDPDGMKEVEARMNSTIVINLEGIPLRTTLKLLLRQVGLDYRVDGGLIVISDVGSIAMQDMKAARQGAMQGAMGLPGGPAAKKAAREEFKKEFAAPK